MSLRAPNRTGICLAIIRNVADAKDVPPLELESLQKTVNVDAIDRLCKRGFEGRIAFQYAGYTVVVHGEDGRVQVAPVRPE